MLVAHIEKVEPTDSGGIRFVAQFLTKRRVFQKPFYIPSVMLGALQNGHPNTSLDNKLRL